MRRLIAHDRSPTLGKLELVGCRLAVAANGIATAGLPILTSDPLDGATLLLGAPAALPVRGKSCEGLNSAPLRRPPSG